MDISAYFEYAFIHENHLNLHWFDNRITDVQIESFEPNFLIKIDGRIKFYVSISPTENKCTIFECCPNGEKNESCYAIYYDNHIKECRYVDEQQNHIVKKFENGEMTEYCSEMDNKNNYERLEKEVYCGKYENNPKLHFPRITGERAVKGTTGDPDAENKNENKENQASS